MELPQGQVAEQVLREHVERAKSFNGTFAAYCRDHGVDYEKFMYCRKLMRSKPPMQRGFAKVEPGATMPVVKSKSYSQLPDPKWLAEVIHNLIGNR